MMLWHEKLEINECTMYRVWRGYENGSTHFPFLRLHIPCFLVGLALRHGAGARIWARAKGKVSTRAAMICSDESTEKN